MLATVALSTVEPRTFAQSKDRDAAEALFRAGREAIQRGDYETACERLRESNRLEPAAGTWLNLGLCEEKLGRWVSASRYYRRVIDAAPAGDPRADLARGRLAGLEPWIPTIELRLEPDAPAATTASIGEAEYPASSFGTALPLDVGEHVVVARARGFAPREYRVSLGKAEHRQLLLGPGPALVSSALHPSVPPPQNLSPTVRDGGAPKALPEPANRTAGWLVLGTGGAILVVGGVTGALALRQKSIVDSECDADGSCDSQRGVDAGSAGATYARVSTVAFAAGAVATGIGVYLLIRDDDGRPVTRLRAAPRNAGAELSFSRQF